MGRKQNRRRSGGGGFLQGSCGLSSVKVLTVEFLLSSSGELRNDGRKRGDGAWRESERGREKSGSSEVSQSLKNAKNESFLSRESNLRAWPSSLVS